ncbi:MAG TPA: DNA translocase FtsK [Candidatus Paceibacterota bacterium]
MSQYKMAKRKREKDDEKEPRNHLKSETIQGVIAILSFAVSILLTLAAFNRAGVAGKIAFHYLSVTLGVGYFMFPLILVLYGAATLKNIHRGFSLSKTIAAVIFFLSGLGIVSVAAQEQGGYLGSLVALPLIKLFGTMAGIILLVALLFICILIVFDTGINLSPLFARVTGLFSRNKETLTITGGQNADAKDDEEEDEEESDVEEEESEEEETEVKVHAATIPKKGDVVAGDFAVNQHIFKYTGKKFIPIPLSLLEKDRGTPGVGDIKANVNIIKRSLQNFGIDVEMDEVTIGPTVTRYALKPAEGVKLSRIVALQNDLSLALAAHPLRIEAPIPGKSLVGIEVPNSTKSTVGLASMLADAEFKQSEKSLMVALGKTIAGKCCFGNLAKMPHLLIAGATGSGKSVIIHGIITSLLYRNSPEHLKFIMIDPKRVELTMYNKIPHLLTPVITEAKKSILALKWAAKEMDRRYDILEAESVRDIESYHKNILTPALKKLEGKRIEAGDENSPKVPVLMPYIVIVIDELADIMSSYPRELESAVVRLAQMSRAVGIHLILSTQRPSVNVITGLIKANIPARVALQVASQIDSRTILDAGGAEKLLGAGDLLYLSGDMAKPSRLQAPFISETEVKKVVKFLIDSYADVFGDEIDLTAPADNTIFEANLDEASLEDDDDLYEVAREEVLRAGKASTSYLQRKLSVGYARAAKLVDMLEERGVVGPGHGARPREVIGAKGDPEEENTVV